MPEYRWSDVDALLIEPQDHLRFPLNDALTRLGIERTTAKATIEEARQVLETTPIDLLVLDAAGPESPTFALINALRHRRERVNPFACVIVSIWEPTDALMARTANCGADAILPKPASPKQLTDRILGLVEQRKPFVVTSDYVGPDRRKSDRDGSGIPLVQVPNTLNLKVVGRLPADEIRTRIDRAVEIVDDQKRVRVAMQLAFLVELALPGLTQAPPERSAVEQLDRVPAAVEELLLRLRDGAARQETEAIGKALVAGVTPAPAGYRRARGQGSGGASHAVARHAVQERSRPGSPRAHPPSRGRGRRLSRPSGRRRRGQGRRRRQGGGLRAPAAGRPAERPGWRCVDGARNRRRRAAAARSLAPRQPPGIKPMIGRFAHAMPFGAELRDNGTVRFRLWAPSAASVALVLEDEAAADRGEPIPLQAKADGWFALVTERARAGTRYRFAIDGELRVADPASRYQPDDVHGPSAVVDPRSYSWRSAGWRGRPWDETVLYELHVGAFTAEGSFDGVRAKLDYLADLGVTAVELMPVADFPGGRNWGYDGVLPFAPDASYGRPDDLKALIDAAHERGLMMFLDVVYNHFGPDGNYLHAYAKPFFTDRHHTPWGAAINFDGPGSRAVRDFFIHNALYWLREYRFDGLRLDAVHAIIDDSNPPVLVELAAAVKLHVAAAEGRHVHLVLENYDNRARLLERDPQGRPRHFTAQWNDDFHHAAHCLATGEGAGYYGDFADRPRDHLARALAEGFVYQSEPSRWRGGAPRGEPSAHLPAGAFVNFLQNHDQIGNRAFGERLAALALPPAPRALVAILLLAPQPPLMFMGEEWAATEPFPFFCDFHDELARAVRDGRRREFAGFPEFADDAARERIPDPNALETFTAARLDWSALDRDGHAAWLDLYRRLLRLRADRIVPWLSAMGGSAASADTWGAGSLRVDWQGNGGRVLTLLANLGAAAADGYRPPRGTLLFESGPAIGADLARGRMPGWSVAWFAGGDEAADGGVA